MNLPVDLDYDFEHKLQELKKKYSYDYMKISGLEPQQMSFTTYIKDFVETQNKSDFSIDGTSNSNRGDVVALLSDISKPLLKLTSFNKIYSETKKVWGKNVADNWLESEYLGKSYLHDAHSASLVPYCYAYDLTKLAREGLFFINNSGESYNAEPAKHLDTFVSLVKEFVSWCCNRQAGAVGLPNLIPYLYYFWIKDIQNGYNGTSAELDDNGNILYGVEGGKYSDDNVNVRYFKQQTQALIYALNQPFLRGGIQSAFTNVSIFDHYYAHALFDGMEFPDGSLAYNHIDNIVTLEMVFMDVVSEIRTKNMFTFPVLSYSILTEDVPVDSDFESKFSNAFYLESVKEYLKNNPDLKTFVKFKDEDFAVWASNHNCKWLDSNFFIDDTVTSLSNCCRLKSDISDLGYFNSIGGTALSVGSIKVNTVNLANIAYASVLETYDEFQGRSIDNPDTVFLRFAENTYLQKLKNQVTLNIKVLDVIRKIIIKNAKDRDLLPNINDGLIDLTHMYNTVGFIGIYETLKTFQNYIVKNENREDLAYIYKDEFDNTYYTKHAEDFVKRIFETIRSASDEFKSKYNIDYSINCEQIPGETAAAKLMKKDSITYPNLAVTDLPLYGNQFIPLDVKTTIEERVRVAALFDKFCNGGSIAHINFESNFPNEQIAFNYLIWLAQQKLTYSAFTTKINACKHNHAFFGNVCPVCGGKVETQYARVVGFYVPVNSFSSSRKEEFELRQWGEF